MSLLVLELLDPRPWVCLSLFTEEDEDTEADSSSLFLAESSRFLAMNCLLFCLNGATACCASLSFRTWER